MDNRELLRLLLQARTAAKVGDSRLALQRIRAAIMMVDPHRSIEAELKIDAPT